MIHIKSLHSLKPHPPPARPDGPVPTYYLVLTSLLLEQQQIRFWLRAFAHVIPYPNSSLTGSFYHSNLGSNITLRVSFLHPPTTPRPPGLGNAPPPRSLYRISQLLLMVITLFFICRFPVTLPSVANSLKEGLCLLCLLLNIQPPTLGPWGALNA